MATRLDTDVRPALLAGIAARERRIRLAGVSTCVLEGGEGPPMLLLHGPGAHAGVWQSVLPSLTTSYRVVAPDLPGHGESTVGAPGLDGDRVLDWLGALIEETCETPPVVVGQLVGGAIAARFAAEHPEGLAGLVLVVPFGLAAFEPTPAFGGALTGYLTAPGDDTHDELWRHCVHDLDALRRRPATRWELLKAYNLDLAGRAGAAGAMQALIEQFGLEAIPDNVLRRIQVPTSLIWGQHDSIVPLSVGRRASERFGWPLHVLEHAGNEPALEAPEEFVRAVRSSVGPNAGMANVSVFQALAARLEGPVLRDGDPTWHDELAIWNGMAASVPAAVVRPASAADVAATVTFAREHDLPLSVKGGGHNIAGTAIVQRGIVLDMADLRDVVVDPAARLARVGAGCRLQDVDRATQEHGLATPLGFVSEVGVAGLTLGGGLGYLTRRFGWTVDNLEEVEVVTADGAIRTASRSENAELFWALRGGGGNFGVVTRFTFRLHDVGPTVYGGLIAWPFARAGEILHAYRAITANAPRELAVWMVLLHAPPAPFVPTRWHGQRLCAMAVCYSGDQAGVDEAMAPIRALGDPVVDLLKEQPYVEVQSYLDATEPKGMHYYWKTDHLAELSDGFLSGLAELFAECPIPEADLGVLHLAGALNERSEDDGAVGNRDARWIFGVKGMWSPDEPNAVAYRRWVRDAWERLHPFSTGRTYVNFQTADEGDERVRDTYGANYERLVDVKTAYDPENLFRSNRNVRPRPQPSTAQETTGGGSSS